MVRYFFHLRNDVNVDDEEGQDLPDPAAAREFALECARDLVCANVKEGHLNLDHYIEVSDEEGRNVLRLSFREAFTLKG